MKKILISIFSFIYLFLLGTPLSKVNIVEASDISYTNVLTDLEKDEDFNKSSYIPSTSGSIEFIQIAESSYKELFIYIFVENASIDDMQLLSIKISTNSENLDFKIYKLKELSNKDRFFKYLVLDFEVSTLSIRKYDITSIHTKHPLYTYDSSGTSEHAFAVNESWTAETINNQVSYSKLEMDVITITDKKVGFLRYDDGFRLSQLAKCDSHYVAFDTDKEIDKLISADVHFWSREYSCSQGLGLSGEKNYQDYVGHYVHLNYLEEVSNEQSGWFAKKYTWNRIETIDTFMENETLSEETITEIKNMNWVLRFYETEYDIIFGTSVTSEYGTEVSEVTLLKLTFETNGKTYNLGVIDNITNDTSPEDPDNTTGGQKDNTCDWFCQLQKAIEEAKKAFEFIIYFIGFILVVLLFYIIISNISNLTTKIKLNKFLNKKKKKKK